MEETRDVDEHPVVQPTASSSGFLESSRPSRSIGGDPWRPYQTFPLSMPTHRFQIRTFAGPRRGKSGPPPPPMNGKLVESLLKNSNQEATTFEVRLVIDVGDESETKIVTLMEAINKTIELDVDLVGVNVQSSPPVVKAIDYKKSVYKAMRAARSKNSANKAKPTKEIKFRVSRGYRTVRGYPLLSLV